MSATVDHEMSKDARNLVADLWTSDEATQGRPQLPPERAPFARDYLALLLVNAKAEAAHAELLQKLYQATFCPPEAGPGFRHNQLPAEETARSVVEHGPDHLPPDQLAALLLNPSALRDLAGRIDRTLPDYWLDRMDRVGRELLERHGLEVSPPAADKAARQNVTARPAAAGPPWPAGAPGPAARSVRVAPAGRPLKLLTRAAVSVLLLLAGGAVGAAGVALLIVRGDRRTIAAQAGQIRSLEVERDGAVARARAFEARNDYLEYVLKQMQDLMDAGPITLSDPQAFTVVEPGRDRIRLAGQINAAYIREVRFRWGVEPEGTFTTLYKGDPQPGPQGKRVPFEAVSPEWERDGKTITATVEFLPYEGARERYPEYFTPAERRYSRTFVLAKDGVRVGTREQPAPARLITVETPAEGAKVSSQEPLEGQSKGPAGSWPVVFVQPITGREPWWAQAPVEMDPASGRFTANLRFGDDQTPPGTKFRIAVVLANSREEALQLWKEKTRMALPARLPRSEYVTVILAKKEP